MRLLHRVIAAFYRHLAPLPRPPRLERISPRYEIAAFTAMTQVTSFPVIIDNSTKQ